jgi:signal transduction histidine kinase
MSLISALRRLFRVSQWSLQRQLVLAFWLVSVVPTMIAAQLAATTLSNIFNANVRVWLEESTKIVEDETRETLRQNAQVAQLLLHYTLGAVPITAERQQMSSDIANAMGIDLVALVRNSDHKVMFSTAADAILTQIKELPDVSLQIVYQGDNPTGTVVSRFPASLDGTDYHLVIASYLDAGFLTSVADVHSLDLRLYLNSSQGMTEVFSTQQFEEHPGGLLAPQIEQILRTSRAPSEQSNARYNGVYRPIFSNDGQLQGAVFSGLLKHSALLGAINQSNLFILLFVVGSALSLGSGWLVARRFTRPLRALLLGVRAITVGDYGQRVEVPDGRELAELSTTFNLMAQRLSDLRGLEAQLRRRDRLHTLGEVAMGLAHEIRNPLGIIKTATQLLHRRAGLAETDQRHLEYVISEVTRINELITEFLEFAKPGEPLCAEFEARAWLQQLLDFCGPELASHQIEALIDEPVPGVTLYADARLLQQACLNLVLNAIDAMPDGGTLRLGILAQQGVTQLSFTDTGNGISADMTERIFNPFVTTKASGTGLGLAKVFSIMESHGGRVECSSPPGQGASFRLYLASHAPVRA